MWRQRRPYKFPPGPQWYPIVGNSVELRRVAKKLCGTQYVYEKWSKVYKSPDVIGFRLGNQYFIVALSASAIKELHTRAVFEGRPRNFFTKLRTIPIRVL
ncbi:hypothetical protein DMENIID0001_147280 [Sergentomyia squamirostris]